MIRTLIATGLHQSPFSVGRDAFDLVILTREFSVGSGFASLQVNTHHVGVMRSPIARVYEFRIVVSKVLGLQRALARGTLNDLLLVDEHGDAVFVSDIRGVDDRLAGSKQVGVLVI